MVRKRPKWPDNGTRAYCDDRLGDALVQASVVGSLAAASTGPAHVAGLPVVLGASAVNPFAGGLAAILHGAASAHIGAGPYPLTPALAGLATGVALCPRTTLATTVWAACTAAGIYAASSTDLPIWWAVTISVVVAGIVAVVATVMHRRIGRDKRAADATDPAVEELAVCDQPTDLKHLFV